MGRPRGTYGEISLAILAAADEGPGTVRALAERSLVGYGHARRTASKLLRLGELTVHQSGRPAVLVRRGDVSGPGVDIASIMQGWGRRLPVD